MREITKIEDNDGRHIHDIIDSVPCPGHGRDIGEACWNLPSVFGYLKAICDRRARSAGANGGISPNTKKEHKR